MNRLIIFLLLFLNVSVAWTATTPNNLGVLQKKIETLGKSLEQDNATQATLTQNLKKFDEMIAQSSEQLRKNQMRIQNTEDLLKKLQLTQEEEKAKLQAQKEQLSKQLQSHYRSGNAPFFKMILSQEPALFPRGMAYYRYFHAQQKIKIQEIEKQLADISQREQTIQATLNELTQLHTQHASALKKQQQEYSQRTQTLTLLNDRIAQKGSQIKTLKADAARLNRIVKTLPRSTSKAATSLAQYRGNLSWPVAGKPTQLFGSLKEGDTRHTGVFFSATEGAPIKAIAGGEVVYADWLRGYGWLLIVDHGNDYMSLYGYNQYLYKKSGDSVSKHEVIARVGRSGTKPEPGLYFELRQRGKPIDPLAFIEKHG